MFCPKVASNTYRIKVSVITTFDNLVVRIFWEKNVTFSYNMNQHDVHGETTFCFLVDDKD